MLSFKLSAFRATERTLRPFQSPHFERNSIFVKTRDVSPPPKRWMRCFSFSSAILTAGYCPQTASWPFADTGSKNAVCEDGDMGTLR